MFFNKKYNRTEMGHILGFGHPDKKLFKLGWIYKKLCSRKINMNFDLINNVIK